MKTKSLFLIMLWFFALGKLSAQTINITTGFDESTNSLIPVWSKDDDWLVSTYLAPTVNSTVACSSGSVGIYGPPPTYTQSCYNVGSSLPVPLTTMRFLTPWMTTCPVGTIPNTNGAYDPGADPGYGLWQYYYSRTFTLTTCGISSASLILTAAYAGDSLGEFIINGHSYSIPLPPINYIPWGGLLSTLTIPINPLHLNGMGSNTITASVVNKAYDTGLALEGQIVVTGNSVDPAFSLSFSGSNLVASSPNSGAHSWEIYGSSSGTPGSYSYVGTYTANPVSIPAGMKCYYVKHSLQYTYQGTTCGPLCAAQYICKSSCDEEPVQCGLAAPTGLTFDGRYLSWSSVSGAGYYILQLIPNDPDCCNGTGTQIINIPCFSTSHLLDVFNDMGLQNNACFSWRVISVCKDGGIGLASGKQCLSGVSTQAKTTSLPKDPAVESANVNIFPNPSKGQVQLDIETASETQLTISITDLTGRVVKTFGNIKTLNQKSTLNWNTESMAKGTYLVKTETADHLVITKKLVIE